MPMCDGAEKQVLCHPARGPCPWAWRAPLARPPLSLLPGSACACHEVCSQAWTVPASSASAPSQPSEAGTVHALEHTSCQSHFMLTHEAALPGSRLSGGRARGARHTHGHGPRAGWHRTCFSAPSHIGMVSAVCYLTLPVLHCLHWHTRCLCYPALPGKTGG